MKTSLSDTEIKDAQTMVNEALKETGGMTSEQDIRLAVACMLLANRLSNACKRLEHIASLEETARTRDDEEDGAGL
jgi:hypothetical protein